MRAVIRCDRHRKAHGQARISVRLTAPDVVHGDGLQGAGAIFQDEPPAFIDGNFVGDHAADDIRRCAGTGWDHNSNNLGRIGLRGDAVLDPPDPVLMARDVRYRDSADEGRALL